MTSLTTRHEISPTYARTLEQTLTIDAPSSDWVKLSGQIAIQVTGAATSVSLQVQRSTHDPEVGANAAPAGDPIGGNPSAGMQPISYVEPGAAWWRVVAVSLIGGSALVAISGKSA